MTGVFDGILYVVSRVVDVSAGTLNGPGIVGRAITMARTDGDDDGAHDGCEDHFHDEGHVANAPPRGKCAES